MKRTSQAADSPEDRGAKFFFPVRLVGNHARSALESGSAWKMLAVFAGGIYCQNQRGDLVFLGLLSSGAGPLNVLCEFPDGWNWQREGFHQATPVCSEGNTIWLAGRYGFPFGNARPWRVADPAGKWDWHAMAERIPRLSREAAQRRLPGGFGPLIPRFSEMIREPSCAPNPLIRAAWPGIRSLFHWLKSDWTAASRDLPFELDEKAVAGLIGLGPGLTPSGDDLLGGMMIALHSLGRKGLAERLAQIVLPHALAGTNTISLAHLTCAAQGEGSEALHDTILALGVKDDRRLATCLEKIGSIGATSGWDAVAGVFLVMQALLEAVPVSARAHESVPGGASISRRQGFREDIWR